MDPLAELVKIDPKSIGVGQYQHDVDQTKLKKALDQTVENCVNLVGVNLNTASSHLLSFLPQNNMDEARKQNCTDDVNREDASLFEDPHQTLQYCL